MSFSCDIIWRCRLLYIISGLRRLYLLSTVYIRLAPPSWLSANPDGNPLSHGALRTTHHVRHPHVALVPLRANRTDCPNHSEPAFPVHARQPTSPVHATPAESHHIHYVLPQATGTVIPRFPKRGLWVWALLYLSRTRWRASGTPRMEKTAGQGWAPWLSPAVHPRLVISLDSEV